MDERSGQLNQPFVETPIGFFALWKPKFLEDFVRFIIKLLIEALEVRKIMSIELSSLKLFDYCLDLLAFPTRHSFRFWSKKNC